MVEVMVFQNYLFEYHELSIADKFVSWGWSNQASNTKIYPLGQFNSRSVKKKS